MPLSAFLCGRHTFAPPVYSTPTLGSRATALFTILFLLSSTIGVSAAEAGRSPITPHKWRTTPTQENSQFRKSPGSPGGLQTFFEVSTPVTSPRDHPVETIQLLYHEFAGTYGVPPPAVQYRPTKRVHKSHWNKVVLKWSAVCRGRQFDRIAGVWLAGVEILRSCTAEPTAKGIFWEVEKDVTRYSSLWKEPQEVVVSIGNVVDSTYTGIINVTLSVEFYREKGAQVGDPEEPDEQLSESESGLESELHSFRATKYSDRPADLILPISEPDYKDGGYWFQSNGAGDPKNASLRIPPNTYRAVLEVCVSYHQNDEFWYTNPPNSYVDANNITGLPGNGSFREVVASIDGHVVGLVWPFVVVYTGGVNPLFWRPAAAIGAFDLPSYDFDITPLLGFLLDQEEHVYELSAPDALDLWILQGNLHLWTDCKRKFTTGGLIEYSVPPSSPNLESDFQGLDGTFITTSSRTFTYLGYVASSFGNLTTSSSHSLQFFHNLTFERDGNLSTVETVTGMESKVMVKTDKREVEYDRVVSSYPFYLYYLEIINPDTSAVIKATIDHSLKKDVQSMRKKCSAFSSLSDTQWSGGDMYISVNNTISGLAATKQTLSYFSTEGCYRRDISAKNYTVLRDDSNLLCSQSS